MTMGVSLLSLVVLSLLKGYALSHKRIYTKYVTLPSPPPHLTLTQACANIKAALAVGVEFIRISLYLFSS